MLLRAPVVVVAPGSRGGCARRGSPARSSAARVIASATDEHVAEVAAEVPARVVRASARPAPTAVAAPALSSVEPARRRVGQAGLRRGRCRRAPASSAAARRGGRTDPRPAPRGSRRSSAAAAAAIVVVDGRRGRRRPRTGAPRSPARLPKTSEVRERVAAEPLRAVHPARALAGARTGRATSVCAGLGLDRDPAHDVVAGRADLHRLLRDVDAGELEELRVHARQLLLAPSRREGARRRGRRRRAASRGPRAPRCRSRARRRRASRAPSASGRSAP